MTHLAFLRAINVGGRALVKMADLKKAFDAAGATNVQTYIQSGNVIFDAPDSATGQAKLVKSIQARLNKLMGKDVDVMYRTHKDLQRMITADPFKNVDTKQDLKLYVAFLKDKPKKRPKLPLTAEKDGLKIIKISGSDVFLVSYPVGKGRYGVPNLFVEKEFDTPATSRNWNTVQKIVKKIAET